jgi:hypothetical protein
VDLIGLPKRRNTRGSIMTTKRPALPLIALGLLLFAAGCGTTEDAAPTTFAEAQAQAAAQGVPLLLDFFTEW